MTGTVYNFVALCLTAYVVLDSVHISHAAGDCTKINSCSCRNSDGTVIDLSPIAKDDGTPQ